MLTSTIQDCQGLKRYWPSHSHYPKLAGFEPCNFFVLTRRYSQRYAVKLRTIIILGFMVRVDSMHFARRTHNSIGECAMVLVAARWGWIDGRTVMPKTSIGMKRAGADAILAYRSRVGFGFKGMRGLVSYALAPLQRFSPAPPISSNV